MERMRDRKNGGADAIRAQASGKFLDGPRIPGNHRLQARVIGGDGQSITVDSSLYLRAICPDGGHGPRRSCHSSHDLPALADDTQQIILSKAARPAQGSDFAQTMPQRYACLNTADIKRVKTGEGRSNHTRLSRLRRHAWRIRQTGALVEVANGGKTAR